MSVVSSALQAFFSSLTQERMATKIAPWMDRMQGVNGWKTSITCGERENQERE